MYNDWRVTAALSDDALALEDAVNPDGPNTHIGPIACGPVVASDVFVSKLKALHRKVTAIETESGGVFSRLTNSNIPAIAVRGISDHADGDKAALEARTKGGARRIAMTNACGVFRMQLANSRFINVAIRHAENKEKGETPLFPVERARENVVSELDQLIRSRLKDLSVEFRTRPDGFYLPVPRARRVEYAEDVAANDVDKPEPLTICLSRHKRVLVRIPRSYPSQALGWSLAHSLIRQPLCEKVTLPFVVQGTAVNPPRDSIHELLPRCLTELNNSDDYQIVVIIEEPVFNNRNRMRFLSESLGKLNAIYLVVTKSEDSVGTVDEFVRENGFIEYELSPVSFSETAFFLEKSFDMSSGEAEAVAIRLDDTFRKFRLDAHPTYFAGLQEETLAALVNANKRAELIQFAVDGLLTLMVAADRSSHPLSRTTRERFLKSLVVEMAISVKPLDETKVMKWAAAFLKEKLLPTPTIEFLNPFFEIGILYKSNEGVYFTHPYLESYLLAEALREDPERALFYFDPWKGVFNYYAYDLYCEMGPDHRVVQKVILFGDESLSMASARYPNRHIYLDTANPMTALSGPKQLQLLTSGLMSTAERLEAEGSNANIRNDKQQILDAKRYVRSEVGNRQPTRTQEMPEDIRLEFDVLDGLSRALSLSATAVGSGSESLGGVDKIRIANQVLELGDKFSDIWTRNRLRVNFSDMRDEMLSDENIWKMVEQFGVEDTKFEAVKSDLQTFIHGFELNHVIEPMGRTLWKISALAGVRVLSPVLNEVSADTPIKDLIRSAWLIDVDPEKGRDAFKRTLADYHGAPVFRIVLANHLSWRTFWHHYKTAGARHFINSARRALRGIGLTPSANRIEQVAKGPPSS
jgi:hypothetical protein